MLGRGLLAALIVICVSPKARAQEIDVTLEHRTRYETLSGQFREASGGGDQALLQRTRLAATARTGRYAATVEAVDARAHLQDEGSVVNTTTSNALDLLQAYGEIGWGDAGGPNTLLRAGRFTLDLGRRRYVARNGFRNTINAFTGVYGRVENGSGDYFEGFYTFPVDRRPFDRESLESDNLQLDRESDAVRFAGALIGSRPADGLHLQVYALRLDERDGPERRTRDRRLTTFGARMEKAPAPETIDFEIEAAAQIGRSRATAAPADATDLDHFAFNIHAEAGRMFAGPAALRVVAQFDYASGDDDPSDARNGRFDPLFGARGFEFSATGIYGPVFRANLLSPGVRAIASPTSRLSGFLMYRTYFLASDRDEWVGSGLADPTGEAGRLVGHVVEASAAWRATQAIRFEAGVSRLSAGRFRRETAGDGEAGATIWTYLQTTLSF